MKRILEKPEGQAPHFGPLAVLLHLTIGVVEHPPLAILQWSVFSQNFPFPVIPAGQAFWLLKIIFQKKIKVNLLLTSATFLTIVTSVIIDTSNSGVTRILSALIDINTRWIWTRRKLVSVLTATLVLFLSYNSPRLINAKTVRSTNIFGAVIVFFLTMFTIVFSRTWARKAWRRRRIQTAPSIETCEDWGIATLIIILKIVLILGQFECDNFKD